MNKSVLQIISFCILIAFTHSANAQIKKYSDADFEGLKGKVKYVREIVSEKKKLIGIISKESIMYCYDYYYDTKGYNIKVDAINDGKIISQTLYEYDYINNRKYTIFVIEGSYRDTNEQIFDKNGLIIKTKGGILGNTVYKYNDIGILQSITTYFSDGSFYVENYLIDKNGNPYQCIKYNKDNKLVERTTYDFDDNGNLLKTEYYNGNLFLVNTTINKYNDKNDIIEENFINNERGFDYTSTFKYKYDTKGNWLKKIEYNKEGKIVQITKRKIKYYDE